jgi:hypothetical protein
MPVIMELMVFVKFVLKEAGALLTLQLRRHAD